MTRDRGDCMTRQEKNTLHIRKQNRLRRKLILSAIQPLLLVLLLISPLLILGTMELCADPSEPVRATFADCHWERKRLILTTADHRQYMLAHHLRADFYDDVKVGSFTISQSLLNFMPIEWMMPSHPLSLPSPFCFNLSQYQGLIQ